MKKIASFFAGVLLLGFHPLGAATFPYTNDFSGTGSNVAFTSESTTPNGTWSVSGGNYVFSFPNNPLNPSTASNVLTGVAGNNFAIQTQFTLGSTGTVNSNGETIGFGFFGLDSVFTGTGVGNSYYLADWQVANTASPGNLRILAVGDTTGFTGTSTTVDADPGSTLAATVGTTYTFKLTGTYSGSILNMTFGIYDVTGTTQIGTSATASDTSPLTGTNFGYRNRIGLGGGTFTGNFDNYSVAAPVPEPGAILSLALAGTLFAAGARRRPRRTV